MARKPKSKPKTPLEELGPRTGDETPHELIYRAYLLGWIHFGTKLAALNRPGSTVYNAYENLGPVVLILFVSIYTGFSSGWKAGLSLFAALAFFGFLFIPRYVLKKLRMRVLEKAFGGEGGWRELWKQGGISMRLASDADVQCHAPDDDWETFARTYLDKPDDAGPWAAIGHSGGESAGDSVGDSGTAGGEKAGAETEKGPSSRRLRGVRIDATSSGDRGAE